MVSLPPQNPQSPSHITPSSATPPESKRDTHTPPESVRFMLACWAVMLGGELLHQILTVVVTVLDPAALRASAKEAASGRGEELSDAMLNVGIYGSVVLMALIQLIILGVFTFALRTLAKRGKWAGNARRLLQFFGAFFAIRMLTLFAMTPASSTVPVALFAADGIIQILLGVAGALGLFYSTRKESVDWVDTGDDPKPNTPDSHAEQGK